MKICGIIAEYNPFHNGHLYHIDKSIEKTRADFIAVVMSGNFTQRGEPALFDKWTRAKCALLHGADVVIELPFLSAVRSAEAFASGGIAVLNAINADYVCFGSETDDIDTLQKYAELFVKQPKEYKKSLKAYLKDGLSFPAARAAAAGGVLIKKGLFNKEQVDGVLTGSNTILSIEYLKALQKSRSAIRPVAVKRQGSGYTDEGFDGALSSALSIRKELLRTGGTANIKTAIPKKAMAVIHDAMNKKADPVSLKNFEKNIFYRLRLGGPGYIESLPEVSEGLENRIYEAARATDNIGDLLFAIKTKRYTMTRLSRILVYALLGITKQTLGAYDAFGVQYIRVLGTSKKGEGLLSRFSRKAGPPLITNPAGRENEFFSLPYDICASDVYALSQTNGKFFKAGRDYTEKLIKV